MESGLNSYLEFLSNYLLYKHNCVTLPTDLERLAAALGVADISFHDMVAEGCVEQAGGELKIRLRRDAPLVRQRFSLAHEIGHIVLNKLVKASSSAQYREFRRYGRVADDLGDEALADRIAGLLLLPSSVIVERLRGQLRLSSIAGIASEANVSLATALIRAIDVATVPSVALMLRSTGQGAPVLKWSRRSLATDRRVVADLVKPSVTEAFWRGVVPTPPVATAPWRSCQIRRRSFEDITTVFALAQLG